MLLPSSVDDTDRDGDGAEATGSTPLIALFPKPLLLLSPLLCLRTWHRPSAAKAPPLAATPLVPCAASVCCFEAISKTIVEAAAEEADVIVLMLLLLLLLAHGLLLTSAISHSPVVSLRDRRRAAADKEQSPAAAAVAGGAAVPLARI